MLTHWLPKISILFVIVRFCSNHILIQLSKKQKRFSQFLLHFWNLHHIVNILKKIWPSQLMYFRNYTLQKKWFYKCLKISFSKHALAVNKSKRSQTFLKSAWHHFYLFLSSVKKKWVRKCLCWKMTFTVYLFPTLQTAKDVVRQMYKKLHFSTAFKVQHVKEFQILVKSSWS